VYKPREGTYVENALKWGVAGLWIDGGRVGTDEMQINTYSGRGPFGDSQVGNDYDSKVTKGRFPANVIHDGSDEVLRGFPETSKGWGTATDSENSKKTSMFGIGGVNANRYDMGGQSAARFFYCAKASRSERNAGLEGMEEKKTGMSNGAQIHGEGYDKGQDIGLNRVIARKNHHPTVKPLALMEYLVRLTRTPTGGVVLDPFMGSGTTGIACVNEGRDFIGIEQNEEYLEIARRRIEYWQKRKQPRLL
jgi:site-specific DNA-methyltransferase (adenine-specific)